MKYIIERKVNSTMVLHFFYLHSTGYTSCLLNVQDTTKHNMRAMAN